MVDLGTGPQRELRNGKHQTGLRNLSFGIALFPYAPLKPGFFPGKI
jgi:hypothetical protein